MLKYLNKIFQIFIDILIFIITLLVFLSLYNMISMKVLHKNQNNIFGLYLWAYILSEQIYFVY